ncbi:hypothetical protein LCM23_14620 [Cytobacillus kochii]|uniref:hypothetical protein n=1 Tax=Cytobacillus kochii TaxID=859143 RepID=UPI001CD51B18|nr:hypothetical protein [Cytobacillus kochii]MCA1027331.1 hypothetical protein [Cytobacillus kochii]
MKKFLIVLGIVILLIAGGIGIWAYTYTKASNEVQSFKVILDNFYQPIEDEVYACIFDGDETEYNCLQKDVEDQIKDVKLKVSSFIIKHDDVAQLKAKVGTNLLLLEEIIKVNNKIDADDEETFMDLSNKLYEHKERLETNNQEIHDILSEYYHYE